MKIGIVGAGPAGLLLAHNLIGRPGYNVHVFDKREDPTLIADTAQDRTYPIALQGRGMAAIREIPGLDTSIQPFGMWIDTVSFHQGKKKAQRMKRPAPSFVIQLTDLTTGMLRHLRDSTPSPSSSLSLHFGCKVDNVFLHNRTLTTDQGSSQVFDHLVAADGVNSVVRSCLAQDPAIDFSCDIQHVPGGYKTLALQLQSQDGSIQLEPNCIHGWMMGSQYILSVPLKEEYSPGVYAFTEDPDPLADFESPTQVFDFLQSQTPDLAPLLSTQEAAALLTRVAQPLCTVQCNRLTPGDQVVLIGDAAHTFSASLNQGCNSGLEDVQILNRFLKASKDDWTKALPAYEAERLIDVDAAHELSNYCLPRTKLMRMEFIGRTILRKLLPTSLSKRLLPPFPTEIVHDEKLSYREMLDKCQWWTDRVKQSMVQSQIENAGKTKQRLL